MPRRVTAPLLRYPGSKAKRAALLASLLPVSYDEYREPFVGSGALLPYVPADVKRWINDLSPDVAGFFRFLRDEPHAVQRINRMVRKLAHNPAALRAAFARAKRRYRAYRSTALDFLLLTRHAACAIVSHHRKDICSVQPHAKNGIHVCSPERVRYWRKLVEEVKITRWDYEKVLLAPGDDVVVFLDPPYLLNDHNSPVYEYPWTLV